MVHRVQFYLFNVSWHVTEVIFLISSINYKHEVQSPSDGQAGSVEDAIFVAFGDYKWDSVSRSFNHLNGTDFVA